MAILLANNVFSTLAVSVSATDTVFTVATGTGSLFPALSSGEYFYITLISPGGLIEIVKATDRDGDDITVIRGQDDTVAVAFVAGSRMEMRINAASVKDYVTQYSATIALEDRYLGPQASDPTLRLNGNPLQSGDFYFNTTVEEMRIYNGTLWKDIAALTLIEEFTATASQTLFTLANAYTVGINNLSVFVNGVRQDSTAYTETSSTEVTFVSGLTAGDSVQFIIR